MAMKPVSVSQVNGFIKRVLQSDPLLGNLSVIGEVSNLKYHTSGHVYFTLKDASSKLNCFLPQEQYARLRYALEEGMEITAVGYISVFERGGTYSLNVRDVIVEGRGNLAAAFEKLREKLEKEGLFDEKYKKQLPPFPKQIAVVTSDTGAAVRDIIKIISDRNDSIRIIVYPCLVQGPDAAADIAKAISEVNRLFPGTDAMIVGRGGGSMEELWAFNEEIVARSIFLSEIPVISAVGHESDVTIADYVADRRAATPTEAAVLASYDKKALAEYLETTGAKLHNIMEVILERAESRTGQYDMDSLRRQLEDRLRWSVLLADKWLQEIRHTADSLFSESENRMERAKAVLDAFHPAAVMEKGYGIILDRDGHLSASVDCFAPGDSLTVIFKDGKINCMTESIERKQNG